MDERRPDRAWSAPPAWGRFPPADRGAGDTLEHGPPRRRVTWRRAIGVLAVLLVLVLLAPAALVDPVVRRVVEGYGSECAELSGVSAGSGRWPVVARALTGSLQDVSVDVDEIRFPSFTVQDASFEMASADVAPLGAALVDPEADVRGGRASGAVPFADIERILAESGMDVALRRDGSRMVADVEVPPLGTFPTGVEVLPVDGHLQIRLAPLDLIDLPPVEMRSTAPFRVSDAAVEDGAVRVDYTFEGVVSPRDARCDVVAGGP